MIYEVREFVFIGRSFETNAGLLHFCQLHDGTWNGGAAKEEHRGNNLQGAKEQRDRRAHSSKRMVVLAVQGWCRANRERLEGVTSSALEPNVQRCVGACSPRRAGDSNAPVDADSAFSSETSTGESGTSLIRRIHLECTITQIKQVPLPWAWGEVWMFVRNEFNGFACGFGVVKS